MSEEQIPTRIPTNEYQKKWSAAQWEMQEKYLAYAKAYRENPENNMAREHAGTQAILGIEKFVIKMVNKRTSNALEREDMMQEAFMAVLNALGAYDGSVTPTSYFESKIKGAFSSMNTSDGISSPHYRSNYKKIVRAMESQGYEVDDWIKKPTIWIKNMLDVEDIHFSIEVIENAIKFGGRTQVSITNEDGEDNTNIASHFVEWNPERHIAETEKKDTLYNAITQLNAFERLVISFFINEPNKSDTKVSEEIKALSDEELFSLGLEKKDLYPQKIRSVYEGALAKLRSNPHIQQYNHKKTTANDNQVEFMDFYLDENDIFEEAEDIFSAVDDGLFEKDGMSISELNRLEF